MSKTVPFSIQTDAMGFSVVVVDGEDVTTKIDGLQLLSVPGSPTLLTLRSVASGILQGEAIVHVEDPAATPFNWKGWLAALPVGEIDAEALNRMGWGDSGTLTATILTIIRELAENEDRS